MKEPPCWVFLSSLILHPSSFSSWGSTMTYEEALAFWFGRVNYEQRSPAPTDLKLDRMRAWRLASEIPRIDCASFTWPAARAKAPRWPCLPSSFSPRRLSNGSIHITTSDPCPGTHSGRWHADFGRRIGDVVGRDPGSKRGAGADLFRACDRPGLLALRTPPRGLGRPRSGPGRCFDSTNICRPLLSIITSISLDHTQQLGNTLPAIAREKAGIIKPGRPVVSGVTAPGAREVVAELRRQQALSLWQAAVWIFASTTRRSPYRLPAPRQSCILRKSPWCGWSPSAMPGRRCAWVC